MQTQLDCIPCFIKQSLDALRQISDDEVIIERCMKKLLKEASQFDLQLSPPEMGQKIHRIIREEFKNIDPYFEIKNRSRQCANDLIFTIKEEISLSSTPFADALRYAIAGNILDFALISSWNAQKIKDTFDTAISHPINQEMVDALKIEIEEASTILYLADNVGEITFDKVFIETFNSKAVIYFAVKDSPIINDATIEDAVEDNLDAFCTIISNGTDAPGTLLNQCSEEFMNIYNQADVIIAKGQANFETLNQVDRNIYFLTQIKCSTIAQRYGYCVGDWLMTTMNKLQAYDEVLL